MNKSYIKNLITGERYWLKSEEITLGRGKENNISLDDTKVSRVHCIIKKNNKKWWLYDNDSTNGTYLNSHRLLDNSCLQDGDILSAGNLRYVFCEEFNSDTHDDLHSTLLKNIFDTETNFSKTASIGITDIFNHAEKHNDDFSKFFVFAQRIHGYLDKEKTIYAAIQNMQKLMNADVVAFFQHPEENQLDLLMSRCREDDPPDLKFSKNLMMEALNRQCGVMDSTYFNSLGSLMCVPLLSHEFQQGVFYLARTENHPKFEEDDLKLVTAMTQHLVLQLEIISLTGKFTDSIEYNLSIRNSLPSALLVVSDNAVIQHLNPAATDIFDRDLHELLGHPLCEFPELAEVDNMLRETLNEGTVVKRSEIYIENPKGERIPTGISCTPIKNSNDKIIGAIANFRDLTEIRSLNKTIKHNQQLVAIGEMSASIAHEIRNPLNSINGFVEIIQNSLDPKSESHGYADIVLNEVNRINAIVKDLLSMARDHSFSSEVITMKEPLETLIKLSEAETMLHGHEFKCINLLPENIKANINKDKLIQVLGNLVRNACESLESQDKARVLITLHTAEHEGWAHGALKISVNDNGCGMPEEIIENIFNPFFSTKDNGTGLGLAVCQKIIDDMNGVIEVESELDQGSTFSILLPVA